MYCAFQQGSGASEEKFPYAVGYHGEGVLASVHAMDAQYEAASCKLPAAECTLVCNLYIRERGQGSVPSRNCGHPGQPVPRSSIYLKAKEE